MLIQGKIVFDKRKRMLVFMGEARKFLFTPITAHFKQISYIQVKEIYSGSHGAGLMWDRIILKMKGRRDIILDHSRNGIYINEMVKNISDCVGCDVHYEPY